MAGEFTLIANAQNASANTVEALFTAGADTLITAFTVSNSTGVNRSYKVYIYDSAGVPAGPVAPIKFVTSNRGFDITVPVIGHVVPKGGTIRAESSAANSLIFRATGRLV